MEMETNPFLRCSVEAVAGAASRRSGRPLSRGVEVFTALREWKNVFR